MQILCILISNILNCVLAVKLHVSFLLSLQCETLLEEYEDDIIEIFRREHEQDEEELICRDLAGKVFSYIHY